MVDLTNGRLIKLARAAYLLEKAIRENADCLETYQFVTERICEGYLTTYCWTDFHNEKESVIAIVGKDAAKVFEGEKITVSSGTRSYIKIVDEISVLINDKETGDIWFTFLIEPN